MKPRPAPIIAVGVLLAVSTMSFAAGPFKSRDEAALEGTWIMASIEQDGSRLPPEAVRQLATTLSFHSGKYSVSTGGKVTEQGEFSVRAKRPRQIDMMPVNGPFAGKKVQGIYQLNGESLTVCYSFNGGERPKKFATGYLSGLFMAEYHRARQ